MNENMIWGLVGIGIGALIVANKDLLCDGAQAAMAITSKTLEGWATALEERQEPETKTENQSEDMK